MNETLPGVPLGPGIHFGVPMPEYLKAPAIGASILRAVVDRCPAAGFYESWRNPDRPSEEDDAAVTEAQKKAQGRGSVGHAILLEGSEAICSVVDPRDHPAEKTGAIPEGWKNKSIRGARDQARAAGKIPVLLDDMAEIRAMVASAQTFIGTLRDDQADVWRAFQPDGGDSEVTMFWKEGDDLCRMRPDRLSKDRSVIVDLKFTARSAEPGSWGRTQLLGMGYYVSAAWYLRGARDLCGVDASYYFLVVEVTPPYLCSLVGVSPEWLALGDSKIRTALKVWDQCKATGVFPAYPARACFPDMPPWADADWAAKQEADAFAIPYDVSKLFQKSEPKKET